MSQPYTYFYSLQTITHYVHSLPSVCLLICNMTIFRFQIHPPVLQYKHYFTVVYIRMKNSNI